MHRRRAGEAYFRVINLREHFVHPRLPFVPCRRQRACALDAKKPPSSRTPSRGKPTLPCSRAREHCQCARLHAPARRTDRTAAPGTRMTRTRWQAGDLCHLRGWSAKCRVQCSAAAQPGTSKHADREPRRFRTGCPGLVERAHAPMDRAQVLGIWLHSREPKVTAPSNTCFFCRCGVHGKTVMDGLWGRGDVRGFVTRLQGTNILC